MCRWAGYDAEEVRLDAPSSLTYGIPDSDVLKGLINGFVTSGTIPLSAIHRYLVSSGLLDQTISYEEYLAMLMEQKNINLKVGETENINNINESTNDNTTTDEVKGSSVSKTTSEEVKGTEDQL